MLRVFFLVSLTPPKSKIIGGDCAKHFVQKDIPPYYILKELTRLGFVEELNPSDEQKYPNNARLRIGLGASSRTASTNLSPRPTHLVKKQLRPGGWNIASSYKLQSMRCGTSFDIKLNQHLHS